MAATEFRFIQPALGANQYNVFECEGGSQLQQAMFSRFLDDRAGLQTRSCIISYSSSIVLFSFRFDVLWAVGLFELFLSFFFGEVGAY